MRKTLEDDYQRKIVVELRKLEKLGLIGFCHIPNQLVRTESLRKIFYALGLRAGAPDLLVFMKGGQVLHIELKAGKNPHLESQKGWQALVEPLGYKYFLVRANSKGDAVKQVLDIVMGEIGK